MKYTNSEEKDDEESSVVSLSKTTIDDVGTENGENLYNDVDLIPKDTGWAWMCCFGKLFRNRLPSDQVFGSFGYAKNEPI